ncbi:MAG: cysteine desulfurase [Desulfovibrio sp.]|jgi:cysteine desulfurase/selenocysteine lyase|nr:cysteine desulfurase [Desulfovibrio sp.]
MSTTTNSDPKRWGLPEERELAAFAAGRLAEYLPRLAYSAVDYDPDPKTGEPNSSYAPLVVAQDGFTRGVYEASPAKAFVPAPRQASLPYVGEYPLEKIRADFPIFAEKIKGRQLVWLDNAATTQRPAQVIERLRHYYEHENSNVHRGAHALAGRSTEAYEGARSKVAAFIGAPGPESIVFVRGATEALNLVANAHVRPLLRPGDEIILTLLEHHSNIVPWQILAEETGALLRVAPVDAGGQILVSEYAKLFNRNTRFVSVTHVSNALGTVTPLEELIAIAHAQGARICVDGAQSVSHMPIDVTALDADFFAFSGHKVFGPTGIGVLYGKSELLEAARPWQGGGNMISDVTFARTVYKKAPEKFEAGTGNIADAVGLGAAIDYVSAIGMDNIARYEQELLAYGYSELGRIPGLRPVGAATHRAGVISFVLDGHSPEEVGRYLNEAGIAVRAGHHCAQPILRHFGYEATVRPSIAFYNTPAEIEHLARTLLALTRLHG